MQNNLYYIKIYCNTIRKSIAHRWSAVLHVQSYTYVVSRSTCDMQTYKQNDDMTVEIYKIKYTV